MRTRLATLLEELEAEVKGLDPDRLSGGQAMSLLRLFESFSRTAAAGRALAATAVQRSNVWQQVGARDASSAIAAETGGTRSSARGDLLLGQALATAEATREALAGGEIPIGTAREIAEAVSVAPEAEAELLDAARSPEVSPREVRDLCRRAVQAATPELDRTIAAHQRRSFRYGRRRDGSWWAQLETTADVGAEVLAALRPYQLEARATHRREATGATPEQVDADAFAAMVTDSRNGVRGKGGPHAAVSLRVDAAVLQRGDVAAGEICEIPGVGPVDASIARSLIGDAGVDLLVTRGRDVASVCRLGRTIPADLRRAVWERDGGTCVVPGCGNRHGLQIDHTRPVNAFGGGGKTELSNLGLLCAWHHHLKTLGLRDLRREGDRWVYTPTERARLAADLRFPRWDHDPPPPEATPASDPPQDATSDPPDAARPDAARSARSRAPDGASALPLALDLVPAG